ncbi:MAG: cyclopropane-fatty-acyl-phospholipid synthase, partial [Synechococcaceae cyanobacterium]
MPTTTGMRGEGFYDTHSSPQWEALAAFLPWLEEAIGRIPLPQGDNGCFRLLDIGSSEGANATRAAERLIQAV